MKDFATVIDGWQWHSSLNVFKRWILERVHAPWLPFTVRGKKLPLVKVNLPEFNFETCELCGGTGKLIVSRHNALMYPCNQLLQPLDDLTYCFRCNGDGKLSWTE